MTRQDVLEKTKRIIFDCFPDMEETICKLEALFDVKIPERQWKKLQTLGDVVDAIYKRIPNKA